MKLDVQFEEMRIWTWERDRELLQAMRKCHASRLGDMSTTNQAY